MPFDEGVFQNQGLEFAASYNNLKIRNFFHHGSHFREMVSVEIAAHAVFQLFGLTDINHFPPVIQHDVHAREQGELISLIQKGFDGCLH